MKEKENCVDGCCNDDLSSAKHFSSARTMRVGVTKFHSDLRRRDRLVTLLNLNGLKRATGQKPKSVANNWSLLRYLALKA